MRRWLLQALQQCILRGRVHGIRRMKQNDARAGPVASDRQKILQRAHLVDADLIAFALAGRLRLVRGREAFRLQQAVVRVVVLGEPVAGRAASAGAAVRPRFLAQQAAGPFAGKFEQPGPFRGLHEQRVRKPSARCEQLRQRFSCHLNSAISDRYNDFFK